ncbi:MAG: 2-oxoglutarate dehydrogenase E1 component [Planctomycetes bacterium]|nr:2-oxoglutarate dehydrogenase E1 component [Planctomycetota bacterium]
MDISNDSLAYVEALFEDFSRDPSSVPDTWQAYFREQNSNGTPAKTGPSFKPRSLFSPPAAANGKAVSAGSHYDVAALQEKVDRLIRVYRARGHRKAKLDPLGRPRDEIAELDLSYFDIDEDELDKPIVSNSIEYLGLNTARKVIEHLEVCYCQSIGVQFLHIDELKVTRWLANKIESTRNTTELSHDEQIHIFTRLNDAVQFEKFLATKYIGSKSFSLEGGESLIPLLDLAIEEAGKQGVKEIVIAMAHRGRLNVLANIMGKNPREIFAEFEDFGSDTPHGDVKYHMGYSNDHVTQGGHKIHLSLCFNASHLEFVNPIALGRIRAKQDRVGDTEHRLGTTLIIHGDAAMIGEGVVQETFNLSELKAYHTGGAVHIVLNNQIGFTTTSEQSRTSTYATDVAKMLQIPIFHVNGEDPEAVAHVVQLAMEFRQEFQRDVVIDMYCYRLRGHNEGDEPSFTQPAMYRDIRAREELKDRYLNHILERGGITEQEAQEIESHPKAFFDEELLAARRQSQIITKQDLQATWSGYRGGDESNALEVSTAIEADKLRDLLRKLATVPDGFTPHPKLKRFLKARLDMVEGTRELDWGAAEALAYGSLAMDGTRIRMTGQDAERGTFTHRHSVMHDFDSGSQHSIFDNLSDTQAKVEIVNSPLSETAVLGFEYGYSLDSPDVLTIWEAQFGDFVNVAQVIIDQFLASAEEKWKRLSGLVMLLPHGMEGQGPEHSSARLERFLNLCVADNMQVVNLTTPAQFFHLMRRQIMRRWMKPLIVMTPKSLLRNPVCVSSIDDLANGEFQTFIPDPIEVTRPKRVLICNGKVYYDLLAARAQHGITDVPIIRLEQLYPLKGETIKAMIAPYPEDTPIYFVQEENENNGALQHFRWTYSHTFNRDRRINWVARAMGASPATGSSKRHKYEQQDIINRALDIAPNK